MLRRSFIGAALAAPFALPLAARQVFQAQSLKHSPQFGIGFDAQGLDEVGDRWIQRHRKFWPRRYRDDFTFQMLRLRDLPHWLDEIYETTYEEFRRCRDVSRIQPARFNVKVELAPFPVAGYSGLYSGTCALDGYAIRAVYYHVAGFGPQNAVDLARGEMRNGFEILTTGRTREMWDVAACP